MIEVLLFIAAPSVLVAMLYFLERRSFSVKELALLSSLTACAVLGRLAFAAIPSVQFATFIIILSGAVFGAEAGFVVGASSVLVSNMFLGHGIWTFFQMLAWGLCGASSGLFQTVFPSASRLAFTVFGFIWGYLFGWIMNLWHWLWFVRPLSFASWLGVNFTSVIFDTTHALTNAVLCWFLMEDLLCILQRFKKKLSCVFVEK